MGGVEPVLVGIGEPTMRHHPGFIVILTEFTQDIDRWAVWVGRHTLEKISRVP